tara:strand:+ start:13420 stop:14325 length:906 start_codon:yes stop_codon:yes gene_type:complete
MKYLVTGGFGFIGTNLVVELLNQGHHVVVIDDCSSDSVSSPQWSDKCDFIQCDIAKPNFYHKFLDGVDTCFHLAAKARVQPSIEDPARFDFTNVHGTVQLFKACVDAGVKKIVFSSSSSVYGDAEMPTAETHSFAPKSPYGLQKKIGEDYLKLFTEIYNIKGVALRYFNVYGEGMPLGGAYATAIGIFFNQVRNGEKITIFGDGEQTRDFTYVKDVVKANILSATTEGLDDYEVFNVGNGDNASVNHVADLIGGERQYLPPKLEPKATLADNSKIKDKLGWKPTGDLDNWVKEYKKIINLT